MNLSARADSLCMAEPMPSSLLAASAGFFFAFRLFIVLLAVRLFGQDAAAGAGAGLALNYLLFGVVAFHSMGPAPRSLRSMLQIPCARWVLLFLCFSGASLFWSSAQSLPAAAAFWFAMVADTAMVVLLLRSGPMDTVVNSVMKGYVWGASAIAVMAWL